ncbi:nidogen-2-like [Oncorhynchus kisutch]|uniref:nidogen-2-like n=2 Tax=Oncorhynchus kisutch TaxID=8019 RepID=UPI0012DF169B|nr:nidogen-2-like [Oncorhynchus kisutch]
MRQLVTPVKGPLKGEVEEVNHNSQTTETPSESLGRVQKETITMATLTIILLFSMGFALGDDTIQPKTPCESARDAAINGPIGAYIPTCDAAGQYTPKQCSGSTGYCWCVTSTGQKIPGTETPPGTAPIKCPCSGPRR